MFKEQIWVLLIFSFIYTLNSADYGLNLKRQERESPDSLWTAESLVSFWGCWEFLPLEEIREKQSSSSCWKGTAQRLFWAKFGPLVSMWIVRSHSYISTGNQGHKHSCTDALRCCITHISKHTCAHYLTHENKSLCPLSVASVLLLLLLAMLNTDCKLQLSSSVLHCLTGIATVLHDLSYVAII